MFHAGCERDDNANKSSNANNRPAASSGGGDLSRGDFEKQKESFEKKAKELGRKIGDGADDLWIWAKTRGALAYADNLRDVTIDVDVENNVVTLSGTVPTEAQKAEAEQVARSIEGVKSVKNNIAVSPARADANKNAR
jgi:osmotically-inducible protein OsmY